MREGKKKVSNTSNGHNSTDDQKVKLTTSTLNDTSAQHN